MLLLAVLTLNYYQALRFALDSFEQRLKERAVVVASNFLEQDEVHQTQFDAINKRYQQILPEEQVFIFDSTNKVVNSSILKSIFISPPLLQKLKDNPEKMVEQVGRQFFGIPYEDEKGRFFIVASAIDKVGNEKLKNQLQTMFLSFFFFLIFIVLAGQYLAKKALTPIQVIIGQVTEISAANLHERVKHSNETDEIAQLAQTFNLMLDRLEEAFQTQSQFVQNASHELRNPLAAMIGHAETTLMKTRDVPYYQDELQVILKESLRLSHIVNSLLQLSMANEAQVNESLVKVRLDDLLLDVIEKLARTKNYHQVKIVWPENQDEELVVEGNRQLLKLALYNLLENACKYSDGKPVTCTYTHLGSIISLTIKDQGIGIPKDEIQKIFIPFYRTTSGREKEGFGIGLAIAYKILKLHGIIIDIESEVGIGTTIQLTFNIK